MAQIGDKAPEFELKNQKGETVTLSSMRGSKVLLAFYPFAFSSVCTDEFSCFRDDLSQFQKKGINVVGISVDSHHAQKAFAQSLGITYPLLSDFSKKASQDFGVLRPEGFSERAYFVINEGGTITFKQVMDSPGKRLQNAELLAALT